jgi:hypothetical protein
MPGVHVMPLHSSVLTVRLLTLLRFLRHSELSTDYPQHTDAGGLSPSFARSLHCTLSTHSRVQPPSVTLFPAEPFVITLEKCLKQAPCGSVTVIARVSVPFSVYLSAEDILLASGCHVIRHCTNDAARRTVVCCVWCTTYNWSAK